MTKMVVFFFSLLLFTSCATSDLLRMAADQAFSPAQTQSPPEASPAAGPTPQPQAAAGLSAADLAEWNRYVGLATQSKAYPKGTTQEGLAKTKVKVGEWAVYRSLESGQVKAVLKMAVVRMEGDAWVYEFVSYSEKEAVVLQEAVQGLEQVVQSGNADQGQLVWVKIRDKTGKVTTLDGPTLSLYGGAYKGMLTANAARYTSKIVDGGPVTVPAGTFASTWTLDSQVSQGKGSEDGKAWVSTVVPLWHLVKAVNHQGTRVLELVEFGTSGYRSSMP